MKVALITGGTKGIGLSVAKNLHKLGYTPVINYFNDDFAAEEVKKTYGYDIIKADVSNFCDVNNMVAEVINKYGKIDLLVNSAGISLKEQLLVDTSLEDMTRLVNVNLLGTILVTKAVLPSMINNHAGVIINLSSVYAKMGGCCEAVYSATKGGVESFTKAVAREVANANIRVNAVAPGFIDTDMNAHITKSEREEFVDTLLIKRIGTAHDVANVVEFLVKNTYITGAIIPVDGGMY